MNKFLLDIAKEQIKEKITDSIPPEKQVAIMLYQYGCTEKEFAEMHDEIDAPKPTLVKIQNHLRDRWKLDKGD
jgi:hypothetical protein